jgi:uncharacterized protein (TIGR00661 family)
MSISKRIFVCPMDWGLGHATRLVPVIRLLLQAGAQPVLGADNKPLAFLRQQFPQLEWVRFPGFQPVYHKKGSLTLKMASAIPAMLKAAEKSHVLLEELIEKYRIDAVIADNRYELWSEKVPTVFMTHQLNIMLPGILATGRPFVRKMINRFIVKHNELWIPDFENEPALSGKLSHIRKMPLQKTFFIGPLSRFEEAGKAKADNCESSLDILCLLSGPEPQRTVFENLLIRQLEKSPKKAILLSGNPEGKEKQVRGNLEIRSHAGDEEMLQLIQSAKIIICRSGYSSLMDLVSLGKKAIFVPTPGQPEQEYLAQKLKKQGLYYACSQKEFTLQKALEASVKYTGLHLSNDYHILKERIKILLQSNR